MIEFNTTEGETLTVPAWRIVACRTQGSGCHLMMEGGHHALVHHDRLVVLHVFVEEAKYQQTHPQTRPDLKSIVRAADYEVRDGEVVLREVERG